MLVTVITNLEVVGAEVGGICVVQLVARERSKRNFHHLGPNHVNHYHKC
jgi:hypothetical protein